MLYNMYVGHHIFFRLYFFVREEIKNGAGQNVKEFCTPYARFFNFFVDKEVMGFLGSGHYHRRTGPVEGCFEFINKL